jgi:subfamily B ATP-binding cassette protein HlyB/CyaB
VLHRAQIETADLVWALAGICGSCRVAFEPRMFLQQFPPPMTFATLERAADALGLRLWRHPASKGLAGIVLPALAVRRSDGAALPRRLGFVIRADEGAMLVADRDGVPRTMSKAEFNAQFEPDLLCTGTRDPAGSERVLGGGKFGLRWFVPEILRYRGIWRDVLLASLALQLVALATPLCTQVVIDKVVVHHTYGTLAVVATALGIFLVFGAALSWARQALVLHTGNRIDAVLGMRVFEHLLRLPPRYFEQRPTGSLVARLQGVETIRAFITSASASVLLDAPFVLIFLGAMLYYSAHLTAIAVAAIAVLVVIGAVFTPPLRRRVDEQFHAGARNQAFLTEYVSAMETVKSLQMEPQLVERYGRNVAAYLRASFAARQLGNHYAVAGSTVEQALTLGILCAGALLVMQGDGFTVGMLIAFQMFASRLVQPVMRLAGLWQEFQQTAIAVQRLGDLMDAPPETYSAAAARSASGPGRLEVDRVAFRYSPERPPVYEHLSFVLEPGSCAALVGPSGSGKSTLAKLLQGFYLPDRGTISIDGRDIRNLPSNELRLHFGVVPQETRLFSGSIWDNLAIAQPHASFDEVVAACRAAEIHDFIDSLPQGYQTPVGEHGAGLSGGQKQRIAIARALLKRPRILIFDEATSNLDHDTADAFARTINRLRGSVTLLFIAHQVPESLSVDAIARLGGQPVPAKAT